MIAMLKWRQMRMLMKRYFYTVFPFVYLFMLACTILLLLIFLFVSFLTIDSQDEKEENEYLRWKIITNKTYINDSDNPNININMNGGKGYWILENKNLENNKDETRMNGISLIRI